MIQYLKLNIQIIEDRQITHEFLINTSYISKDYNFDFYYIGKFFYLNETNIDFLSNNSTDNKNWILLIKDFSTFNKYVSYNKSLLKHLTKAIIIHKNVFRYKPINKYALIISNPPYVSKEETVGPEIKYEPANAIFAKKDGLLFYEHIIKQSTKWVNGKNILAFEIGYNQGSYLKKYAKTIYPKAKIEVKKDLSGKDRYLFIINK